MRRFRRRSSGSPRSSEGDSEVGLGFFIALAVVAMLFIASFIESFRASGSVNYVAICVVVVTGLLLVWIVAVMLFGRFVMAVVARAVAKAKGAA